MHITRVLSLPDLLSRKSHFLFGPRATGKSFLIRHQFDQGSVVINLLKPDVYLELSTKPENLEAIIKAAPSYDVVIIDEVQRVPELLNEVHRLIEEEGIRFLLTGSSARKLKRGGANLLAVKASTEG